MNEFQEDIEYVANILSFVSLVSAACGMMILWMSDSHILAACLMIGSVVIALAAVWLLVVIKRHAERTLYLKGNGKSLTSKQD